MKRKTSSKKLSKEPIGFWDLEPFDSDDPEAKYYSQKVDEILYGWARERDS